MCTFGIKIKIEEILFYYALTLEPYWINNNANNQVLDLEEVPARQCKTEYQPLGVNLLERYYTHCICTHKDERIEHILHILGLPTTVRFSLAARCALEVVVGRTLAQGIVGGLSWLGKAIRGN